MYRVKVRSGFLDGLIGDSNFFPNSRHFYLSFLDTMSSWLYGQISSLLRTVLTIFTILFLLPVFSIAAQVTMAWDPNDPAPEGYRIFQRTENQAYDYSQPVWTSSGTTGTVYNLDYDTAYYFVVRAYAGGEESTDSNEVSFSAPSPAPATRTIAVVAGSNGAVSPGNTVTLTSGSDQTFSISPETGYHVADVKVDGVSVGAVSSYTFNNVSADHTLTVTFAIETFTITASAGTNGTITPAGSISVDHGLGKTYSITPDAGHHVLDVKVNSVSIGAVNSYTFANVTADQTINATFESDSQTISLTAGPNGTITPNGSVDVAYGGSQAVTFTADPGFHIADVQVDGLSVGAVEKYSFTSVTDDHSLTVTFSANTMLKIWMEAEDGDLQWPMEIGDDVSAGAGGYIWVPTGNGNITEPTEAAGYAEYHFEIPETGNYVIWGHQISKDTASDSFFVSVDGQAEMVWHTKIGSQDIWTWDVVSERAYDDSRDTTNPKLYHLEAGNHTLTIKQREDETKIDRILITNQTDLTNPEPDSVVASKEFGDVQIDHTWTRVNFEEPFVNPVVVAGPLSLNGSHPAVVRIQNVDTTGFEIRLQEWEYLDGSHTTETVSYLVMEQGSYTLEDGTKIVAVNLETSAAASFKQIAFSEPFNIPPVVMTAVTSFNDPGTVTGRMKTITVDGFNYRMQEQEANTQDHGTEQLSYIAWEPSFGTVGKTTYLIEKTSNAVKHKIYNVAFENQTDSAPAFLANMQTTDGGDTANVRCDNRDNLSVGVLIDEEQSKDSEVNHTGEIVGYMVLGHLPMSN